MINIVEAIVEIEEAELEEIKFSVEQVELIANLELIYYGEAIVAEELDREGMVDHGQSGS